MSKLTENLALVKKITNNIQVYLIKNKVKQEFQH